MAWTTPRTWVVDELVTAAIMNLHLRDNLSTLWPYLASQDIAIATGATTLGKIAIGTNTQNLKVLSGAVGWNSPFGWSLHSTVDQTIPNAAITGIVFSTEDYDNPAGYHGAGSTVTIPANMGGYYIVSLKGNYASSARAGSGIQLWVEENVSHELFINDSKVVSQNPALAISFSFSAIVNLTAGQVLVCKTSQHMAAGETLDLRFPIYFSGMKVA